MSNIPSVDSYKSTTNKSEVHLVGTEYQSTHTLMIPSRIPSIVTTNLHKLRDSKICQQIWMRIFNNKKYSKYLKRYDSNENHCCKANENWSSVISASQCDFILKSDYTPHKILDPYACNTSNLADRYIFKILDINILESIIDQSWNTLERTCKRYPKGGGGVHY